MTPSLSKIKLSSGEIHLWCVFQDEITDKDILAGYEKLLSPEETEQWPKFHFARHRHQYLVSRALVRSTLSRYIDIDPEEWTYSKNKYGRPEIANATADPRLRFNLSHTEGSIIMGVTQADDMGVDVEDLKRGGSLLEIADRYFSPLEVNELRSLPSEQQPARFLDYWTLKESFIKARGMGLSLPLDQFSFHLNQKEPLSISFESQDDPKPWQFWRLRLSPQHVAAVAVQRSHPLDYQLVVKKTIPLMEDVEFEYKIIDRS